MSRPQTEKFAFKNVSHIKRVNFGPDGSLLSKQRVAHNIERYANMTDDKKRDEIERQRSIPNLSHGFTTVMCYAGWCGHCVKAKPIYDNICKASKCMNVQLCAIDCANDTEGLVDALNDILHNKFTHENKDDKLIRGFPTFLQFKDGHFYRRYEDSSQDSEKLLAFIVGV
ncbi:MAG: protein disulfide isomerase family protein [Candidatus Colwellbacteria bacterium]|nr:protein disulfide isomerase family protein [Candidatus Colwellbacteria bacterium]